MLSRLHSPMRTSPDATVGLTLRYTLEGPSEGVTRLAWSPDGRSLAVPTRDGWVRLHDAATGWLHGTLPRECDAVLGVAWSPDSRRLATISSARGTTIRDTETGRLLHRVREPGETPSGVAWSPCGTRLAVAEEGPEGLVRVFDVAGPTMSQVATLPVPGALHVAWDRTGARVGVGTRDGGVHRWNVHPVLLLESERPHRSPVVHVAWSSSATGDVLASASKDGTIGLRDLRPRGERQVLTAHRGDVIAVAFDPTARYLASKSRDGTVLLWRTGLWHVVAAIREPTAEIGWSVGLAFHPGGRLLATLGEHDRIVRVWELDDVVLPPGPLDAQAIASLGPRATPGTATTAIAARRHRVRLR